ncbi:GntR family transcriptional regulator [Roseivivax sp. CAU 1761]
MPDLDLPALTLPRAQSATEQVFEALRRAIVQIDLAPGTKLTEADMARRLGVSRQPVRDAFFRLSNLGFITIRPQRATLVTLISARLVLQAAFIRTAIETACIREAATARRPADLDALEALLAAQEEAVRAADPARFHDLDEALHLRLAEIAGRGFAWSLVQEQKAHMDRVRFLTLPADSRPALDGHRAIVAALRARDAAAAEVAMQAHLARIRDVLPRIAAAHPAYFDPEG